MTYIASPEPDPNLPPGFRVYPDELGSDRAIQLMLDAVAEIIETFLDERRRLFHEGFSDEHSLLKEMDDACRRWAVIREVLERQERTLWVENVDTKGRV